MLRPLLLKAVGLCIATVLFLPLAIIALCQRKLREAFSPKARKDRPAVFDSYGTHRFLDLPKGKIRIHVVDSGREGDKRPLMLFVHGFPDFWYSYRHQMKHFSSKFRCVSMDNRGYNESDKPGNIQDYSVDKLARDVKEVVEVLGYDKCVLVGHDWGGIIGYEVCTQYPEIVSIYFALNIPHGSAFMDSISNSWAQRFASWYMVYFQCPILPELMINSFDMAAWNKIYKDVAFDTVEERQQDLEAYKYVFSQPNSLTGPLNFYRCFIQYPKETPSKMKPIQVPVCSIYGNGDKALLREGILGSAKYVEDFTFRELNNISHWVHLQAPKDVNRLMEEYIELKEDLVFK